jgi:hypothetical protein
MMLIDIAVPHSHRRVVEMNEYTLHEAGQGRLILTIPKSIFGSMAWNMRDVISKELFPKVHDGSLPAWSGFTDRAYQVELYDAEKADQLIALIDQWVKDTAC